MTDSYAPFQKMNGIGNQIVIADLRGRSDRITPDAARHLAQPEILGFDQIMEIADPAGPGRDQDMRIINSDGSLAQACGNGTRCVVDWLHRQDGKQTYRLRTPVDTIEATIDSAGAITVDMGVPRFGWQEIPLAEEFADTTGIELQIGPIDAPVLHTPSVASMGNPHAIFWVDGDVDGYDLERLGPLLENHPIFPERANITVAHVESPQRISMRTWERGAGLTLACGSAACATLVSAVRKGLAEPAAQMRLRGGDLEVTWRDDGHVLMSGPVEWEFAGRLDPLTGTVIGEQDREQA